MNTTTVFGIVVSVRSDMPNSVMRMGYPHADGQLKPGYVETVLQISKNSPDQSAGGTTR